MGNKDKTQDKGLEEGLADIVLGIRQYLCNTEFAPEPFTESVDIQKLKVEFPAAILQAVKVSGYLSPEEVEAEFQKRIKEGGYVKLVDDSTGVLPQGAADELRFRKDAKVIETLKASKVARK